VGLNFLQSFVGKMVTTLFEEGLLAKAKNGVRVYFVLEKMCLSKLLQALL
jgi:hypothetical protein